MEYRNLGKSGLKVSALSFGTWINFGHDTFVTEGRCGELVVKAFELGVNYFDTAEGYAEGRAEEVLGSIFRKTGWRREDLVIGTKIFWAKRHKMPLGPNDLGISRKRILEGTLASLKRLNMNYVDLIFAHRPDPNTPIEETVRAFDYLITKGLALYWGTSEWSSSQIMEAHNIARQEHLTPPTMEQPEYNMLTRNKVDVEYQKLYNGIGLGTTTWSPLKYGILTGKYNSGIPKQGRGTFNIYVQEYLSSEEGKESLKKIEKLQPVAQSLGCTMAQLAIAWCLVNPNVSTVITGGTTVNQIMENMMALSVKEKLTPDVMEEIKLILDE